MNETEKKKTSTKVGIWSYLHHPFWWFDNILNKFPIRYEAKQPNKMVSYLKNQK